MDPSALIFIVLALAWVAYLVPKALEHHEESARSRSISTFSDGLRVLARREPTSRRRTRLVTGDEALDAPVDARPSRRERRAARRRVSLTPAERRVLLRAAPAAARRRRRVLDLLGAAVVAIGALVIWGVLDWHWLGVPVGLVLLWLALSARAARRSRRLLSLPLAEPPLPVEPPSPVELVETPPSVEPASSVELVETPASVEPVSTKPANTPAWWDLQPLHVPTYVAKAPARREVRTIDLESTGVWSSGRNDADSALVREAEASEASEEAAEAAEQPETRRAAGD